MTDFLFHNQKKENNTLQLSLKQRLSAMESLVNEMKEKIIVQKQEILEEREHWENLLHNVLPEEISRELLKNGKVLPQFYPNVTVMFTDFMGFTSMCEKIKLQDLIQELDSHFSHFDDICEQHYLEKIKTIGDAYMCAGGMPMRNHSHPFDAILAAVDIIRYMRNLNDEKRKRGELEWHLRIGIHTGSVIAGIVGKKKFLYDIWGDTVNMASRMESGGVPDRINISGTTYERVKDYFDCTYRGSLPVKNKNNIDMYFVDKFLPQYTDDVEGKIPNEAFNLAIRKL